MTEEQRPLDVIQNEAPISVFGAVLLAQGAEAGCFQGQSVIIKERFAKHYRHPDLDVKLTRRRTKAEAKCITKCQDLDEVSVPKVVHIDTRAARLFIEYIDAPTVKHYLFSLSCTNGVSDAFRDVAVKLGKAVASIHNANIIHGDLTTSNILRCDDGRLVLIDFGLSFGSTLAEDKAVDLYVLERALLSTHSELTDLFDVILKTYESQSNDATSIIKRFNAVRMRGRKRCMIG